MNLPPPHASPASFVERLAAWAQITQLNADLLSHDSATATLQVWCDLHGGGQKIIAHRVRAQDRPPSAEDRAALGAAPDEPLVYRRVQLACGDQVLSEADNWYRPRLLTAEMNRALEETETPFGVVVRPLNFRRRTLTTTYLFRPLPLNWEETPAAVRVKRGQLAVPNNVLQHRAILLDDGGKPFSLVVETYTDAILIRRKP